MKILRTQPAAQDRDSSMNPLSNPNDKYGRLFLVTASLVVWLVVLVLFKVYGYDETWRLWRVPVEHPPFLDFRLIPGSAETFRSGIEPTERNPSDPRKRIFNYPFFWRLFFYTGITQQDTIWIVVVMLILFFAGVFLFPGSLSIVDSAFLLLIVFSPASMLLYERGNVDLSVFFLCALIVFATDYSAFLTAALVVIATIVKIFPFFGATVLLRETKSRFFRLFLGCLAALLSYLYLTFGSVKAAWNLTMRGYEISYGANVFFLRYGRIFSELLNVPQSSSVLKFGSIVLAFILMFIAGMIGLANQAPLPSASSRNLAAFRMGASIYLGTFLLGNNWDYRLAFLIFVIPQLLQWIRQSDQKRYRFATLTALTLIFSSCWHFMLWYAPSLMNVREILFVIDEIINWTLVAGLSYLLCASLPAWAKEQIRFFVPGRRPARIASDDDTLRHAK